MERVTDDQLAAAVAAAFSMREVISLLGRQYKGGTHAHYRKRVIKLGLDTSHWRVRGWNGGGNKKSPNEVLIERPEDAYRAPASQLRRVMIEIGIPYVCSECGQPPIWNDLPLTLQVDHINGVSTDNRPQNVRFLCPNCHTQTPTYGKKSNIALSSNRQDAGI